MKIAALENAKLRELAGELSTELGQEQCYNCMCLYSHKDCGDSAGHHGRRQRVLARAAALGAKGAKS